MNEKTFPKDAIIPISKCHIRIRNVYLAIRIVHEGHRSLLMVPDASDQQKVLPGGPCNGPLEDLYGTLMRHVREQLCIKYEMYTLEAHLVETLQHRSVGRLIGGGTFFAPFVTSYGYQSFDAYVVVDALPSMLGSMHPSLTLFDAKSSASNGSKDHLLSLLRMRYKTSRTSKKI